MWLFRRLYLKKNNFLFVFISFLLFYLIFSTLIFNYKYFSIENDKSKIDQNIRIFCFIFTYEQNLINKAQSVYKTWAHKCDNFKFILKFTSDLTIKNTRVFLNGIDTELPAHSVLDPGIVIEKYRKLTDKIYQSLIYINKHFGNFGWYMKADDDTYVITDNLRKFISSKNASEPVTFGFDFKRFLKKGYQSGGAGYLMSREAVKRIAFQLKKNYSSCPNRGIEDVDIAACFRLVQVYPGLSRDYLGKERFHPLSIKSLFYGRFPKWYLKFSAQEPAKVFFKYIIIKYKNF